MYNGLQYVTPYELRHTFASNNKLLETWILDEVMGHAHEGMSLGVYAHACEGDMDGVTDRIDGNLLKQIDRGQKHIQKSNKKHNSGAVQIATSSLGCFFYLSMCFCVNLFFVLCKEESYFK